MATKEVRHNLVSPSNRPDNLSPQELFVSHSPEHHLWGSERLSNPRLVLLLTGFPEGAGELTNDPPCTLDELLTTLAIQEIDFKQFYIGSHNPTHITTNHQHFPKGLFENLPAKTEITVVAYSMGAMSLPMLPESVLRKTKKIILMNACVGVEQLEFGGQASSALFRIASAMARVLAGSRFIGIPSVTDYLSRLSEIVQQYGISITYAYDPNDEFLSHRQVSPFLLSQLIEPELIETVALEGQGHALTPEQILQQLERRSSH